MSIRHLDLKLRILFLAFLTIGFGLAALGPAQQALEQRRALESEHQKLMALRSANSELEKHLSRLNDQEYLEKAAREQLGLVRPGETSYIVESPPEQPVQRPGGAHSSAWHERAWAWVASLFR